MNITWGILSKYRNELYGFSIIWIILFHGMNLAKTDLPKVFSFLKPFLKHGNCGVEIFLFLSGISLYFSLKKQPDIIRFYKNRLSRIVVPFLLIDGVYWSYTCLYKQSDLLLFIQKITFYSFWFLKDTAVWFIAFIILMYAIYPILFNVIDKGKHRIYCYTLLIGLSYIFCLLEKAINPVWFNCVEIALSRVPVFLLGCYFGKLVYDNEKIGDYVKILTLVISFYGVTYFYQHPYSLVKYYRITYFLVGPCLALWLAIFMDIISNNTINRLLQIWGGLSLELYLSHLVLREIYIKTWLYGNSYKINYCIYLLICLIGAFGISYVVNKLNERSLKSILKWN